MSKSTFLAGQPIFSQLISLFDKKIISSCVQLYNSDRYYKKFNTYHHLLTMLYACFQNCTSLREVVTGLSAWEGKLQCVNINHYPTRSTLSDANKNRNYEVFEKIFYKLLDRYRKLLPDSRCNDPFIKRLIIIDSTTISLFKEILKGIGHRAKNGKKKGGIKAHMASKPSEDVPYLVKFSPGAYSDSPFMKQLNPPAGSIVVMDRGYHNYKCLNEWKTSGVDWVMRIRKSAYYEVKENLIVSEEEVKQGVISDQLIIMGVLNGQIERVECRLVKYYDAKMNKTFEFICSSQEWSALKIAQLYKQRWQIELLFKRLKQNTTLEYFLGDNENAIKIQIFCALICDLLLQIALLKIKRKWAHSNLCSFIRIHLMNYFHLKDFLNDPDKIKVKTPPPQNNQLKLKLSG